MTRLIIVAAAAIGLILFVAFVISRLVRTRTRGMSIRLQVFLALALIVGTFAFGLGVMVIDRVEARAVRIATQAAEDEARAIAGILQGEMERGGVDVSVVAARLEVERAHGADLRLELVDAGGTVLFPRGKESAVDQPGTVYFDARVVALGRTVGAVRVVKETVVMRRLLEDFAPTVLVISLVLGAAAAISALWIGRSIARPIEALSAFSQRVAEGERAVRPPVTSGREVTRLAQSIDSMRRQLEGRPFVETFAADLSHELKNPVAAVRASAEVLEEGAIDDPAAARQFVARIREATARIERLLGDLLSLARIEARGVEDLEPVDVGAAAEVAIGAFADARDRLVLRTRASDVRVRGDASWLTRALGNLVENALIHSAGGTPIEVDVSREAGAVIVRVRNEGTIEPRVAERMFRRFVTTRGDRGGTGLGLSIVRAVAEAHGGTVELASARPTVELVLTLPPAFKGPAEQLREAVDDVRGSSPTASVRS